MKWFAKSIVGILLLSVTYSLHCCPTCVGRLNEKGPVFFSDEFYKPQPKQQPKNKNVNENKNRNNKVNK